MVYAHLYFNLSLYFITFFSASIFIQSCLSQFVSKQDFVMDTVELYLAQGVLKIYSKFLYFATFCSLHSFSLFAQSDGLVERGCSCVAQ